MTAFMNKTISDIRGGRETWRVVTLFSMVSMAISVAFTVLRHPF